MYTGFWWGGLREGDLLQDLGYMDIEIDLAEVGCHGLY